ncbi:3'-5' exonuclease, partial [Acinetobacter baumannii]
KITRLQQNFRSTAHILAAANRLIAHNRMRHGKTLVPTNDPGNEVVSSRFNSAPGEADFVADEILKLIAQGKPRKEIAVISRTASVLQLI